jgi:hypothetical protein
MMKNSFAEAYMLLMCYRFMESGGHAAMLGGRILFLFGQNVTLSAAECTALLRCRCKVGNIAIVGTLPSRTPRNVWVVSVY